MFAVLIFEYKVSIFENNNLKNQTGISRKKITYLSSTLMISIKKIWLKLGFILLYFCQFYVLIVDVFHYLVWTFWLRPEKSFDQQTCFHDLLEWYSWYPNSFCVGFNYICICSFLQVYMFVFQNNLTNNQVQFLMFLNVIAIF